MPMKLIYPLLFFFFISECGFAQNPVLGPWRGEIKHLGGPLPFNFIVAKNKTKNKLDIRFQNGAEIANLGDAYFRGDSLVIPFELYDSELVGSLHNGKSLLGFWQKKQRISMLK